MFGNVTALVGLHVTGKYRDESMKHAGLMTWEEPRPHASSMCAARFVLYFPVTCNPTRAVTLPNIGVPLYIGVPHRVTYPYEACLEQGSAAGGCLLWSYNPV